MEEPWNFRRFDPCIACALHVTDSNGKELVQVKVISPEHRAMETFLLSFAVIMLALFGLAIGVLFGKRPIQGSCGGLNNIEGAECAVCTGRCEKRKRYPASVIGD